MRKGKERFFLQLVAEGTSPLKHAYAGKDLHMAIDPGLGSLTYATEDGTIAKVQIAPSADTDRRAIRRIPTTTKLLTLFVTAKRRSPSR